MKKFLVLVAAVCMAYTTAFAQTVKPFKEGDRAVFLGIVLRMVVVTIHLSGCIT